MKRDEASVRTTALCLQRTDQERLIQHVVGANITDVVVTGCDGKPCPPLLKSNLNWLQCTLSGLNLMEHATHRGDPAFVHPLDLEQAILTHRVPIGLMHGSGEPATDAAELPLSTVAPVKHSMNWVRADLPIGGK